MRGLRRIRRLFRSTFSRRREIEELSRVEEALVEAAIARGEAVHRSGSALPQAVLGVRVLDKAERISRGAA